MPAVPRYERQVAPGAMPTVQVARDIQTGDPTAVARASAQVADQTAKMAMQEKGKADDAWGKQAYAEMVSRKNDLLHGQNGALRKQGRDALAILPEAEAEFDKYAEELGAKASNETQRSMLHQFRQREAGELRTTLQRHAAQETERIQDDAFKTLTESLSDDSINNPAKAAENLAMLRAAANDYADRKGWDGADDETRALRKGLLEGLDSRVHGGIVLRMLQQENDRGAKAYFDANKDAITDARMRGQVEQALEEGGRLGTAMRLADKLVATRPEESLALKDIQAEFEAGRIDAKTRQVAEIRVKQAYQDKRQVDAQAYADNLNQAYLTIQQSKRIPDASIWSWVEGKDQVHLLNYLDHVAQGKPIKTERQVFYDLQRMAANPDTREKFASLNLMAYRNQLSDGDFKQMVGLQTGLARRDEKTEKALDDFRSDDRVVSDAMPKSVRKNKEKAAEFSAAVAAEQTRMQAQLGRKLSNKELQEIADRMAMDVVKERNWMWDTSEPLYELEVDGVPKDMMPEIAAAIQSKKKPVTVQNIKDTYSRFLKAQTSAQ